VLSPSHTVTLLLSQEDAPLKPEGKEAHVNTTVFQTYFGSMLSPVRNTVILQCFDSVGWATGREGHPACKNLLLQNPLYENQEGNWLTRV